MKSTVAPGSGLNWSLTQYDESIPFVLNQHGFTLRFPDQSGQMNSLQADRKGAPIRKVKTKGKPFFQIEILYHIRKVEGNPQFGYVDHSGTGNEAPNFRPCVSSDFLDNRHWPSGANCAFLKVTPKPVIYTVKLLPSLWQDVNGHVDPNGFTSTFESDGLWHLSFGGGGNFEHGVYVTGGVAAMDLLSFNVK